jgi:hypothetical protein
MKGFESSFRIAFAESLREETQLIILLVPSSLCWMTASSESFVKDSATSTSRVVENMERCLEDLIIRMIYVMTCRKGLSIYPLLLFVVVTDKERSHHRITGCWLQSP